MKIVSLAKYEANADAQSPKTFNLLYSAVFNNEKESVGSDKQATRRLVKLMDVIEAAGEKVQNGNAIRLRAEGADLAFEEAEFTQLQAMWESFRGQCRATWARDVAAVDDALEGARTVTAAELVK